MTIHFEDINEVPEFHRRYVADILTEGNTTQTAATSPTAGKGRHTGRNKYNAVRTYSELCQRTFDSKAEARRGEELKLLEKSGKISLLEYQIKYVLCKQPKITVTLDFYYKDKETGQYHLEDVKGVLTRDSRTKYAWLESLYPIKIEIVK